MWRWWEDLLLFKDLMFQVRNADEGEYAADSAAVFAGAVIANNLSHSHVIYTFVHEVNQEISGDKCFYKLRLVQVCPSCCLHEAPNSFPCSSSM